MDITDLQQALDATPYKGQVINVFSSKFGQKYDVGLVQLLDGEKVVIKVKNNSRAKNYRGAYSREVEYKNLLALEKLENKYIPRAIYYKNGTLLMTFLEGEPLRMVDQSSLDTKTFKIIGETLRKVNDLNIHDFNHIIKFDSFKEFLLHEFDLFFSERLTLKVIPRSFYDEFRNQMLLKVVDDYPADLGIIAKDAYGAENILIKDRNLSGLIDFEDLMIAPRILQLRPPLDEEFMSDYIDGYGKEVFNKNYYKPHLDILKAISSLRAFYLADEKNDIEFVKVCVRNFREIMINLNCDLEISI